eukprot:TRINITY_DN1671_c0_g1_i2.p1 TRINITY_DN1671_c0_g1~~TRINITY_DN1671_c0_g1_i2.p1  ORF type:complete len:301 (-),score=39.25 TRINITY_DN1671_c0_g1_i2:150-1052(-)
MEHDPSEKTVQERKPKRKQKKASKNDREADDPTLPQLVSLTKEQQECLEAFKKRAEELSRQYDADLRTWAADTLCLLRYLRARNFNIEKSEKMLAESLKWRSEFGPHKINPDDVKEVLKLGTLYQNGKDKEGRPLLFIKPGTYNPHSVETKVRTMIYTLEQAIARMDRSKGVEKMVWFMDFTDYASRARSPDGRKVAQTCLGLLQDHYPERLGLAFIVNPPWWVSLLFTILSPFMDAVTKAKIHFISGDPAKLHAQLCDFVEDDQLERCYGGLRDVPNFTNESSLATGASFGTPPSADTS